MNNMVTVRALKWSFAKFIKKKVNKKSPRRGFSFISSFCF